MTDPKHAEHVVGKGRYYTRPSTGEQLISVTNVLDTMAKHGIPKWAAGLAADHAVANLPRLVKASRSRTALEEMRFEIKNQAEVVRERASDLGTRVHRMAEAHILDRPEPDDPEAAPYVDQYLRWIKDFGVDILTDIEFAEATVLNTRDGYAGTLDLGVRLKTKHNSAGLTVTGLWLVDLKSSATQPANRVYETHPLQLTAYSRADLILLDDGTEVAMPGPISGVATLNLRVDDYGFIPLPFTDREYAAFLGLKTAAEWQHNEWRDCKPKPVTPTGEAKPRRTTKRKAS